MYIVALQTARKGSQEVCGKNTMTIKGQPLFMHNLIYANNSKKIQRVYVSTDDEFIKQEASLNGVEVIDRPTHLKGNNSSHWATIIHGLLIIEELTKIKVDILVILLGNTIGAYTHDIDKSIIMLESDQKLDSVMSVSMANFHNPFRAYKIANNYLTTIVPQELITNEAIDVTSDRNCAGNTYFFNGSFWTIRRKSLIQCNGLEPFPWLGKKIAPLVQNPALQEIDMNWQSIILENINHETERI